MLALGDKKIGVCAYPAVVNIVARSKNMDTARNLARILGKNYSASIKSSRLVYSRGVCLSVKVKTVTAPQMLGAICEHSDIVCIGKNYESILCEYGSVIYEENAIERLSLNQ